MSDFSEYLLPFDPYANQASNFIQNESYAISTVGSEERQQIVPRHGAFYPTDDFKIVHQASGVTLKENIDFIFSYFCREVYKATNSYAFGSIVLLNKTLYGTLLIDARYVGGDYGFPPEDLIPAIISYDKTQDTFIWEDVQDIPAEYPVDSHTISSKLLTTGFEDMVDVLVLINESITKIGTHATPITIDDVLGLQDELNDRIDNSGQSQANRVSATLAYPGYIELVLPGLLAVSKLGITLDVVLKSGYFTFSVHGSVSTGLNTSPWLNTYARVIGAQRTFNIYSGYKDSKPALYFGPFDEEQAPEKLLASLRHYIVDNVPSEFTPEFSLAIVPEPVGYTNITARYNANDHQHPIAAIDGLQAWIDTTESDIQSLSDGLNQTNLNLDQVADDLGSLTQQHTDDVDTLTQSIGTVSQNLSTLSNTVTQNQQAAALEYEKIANNKTNIDKVVNYLNKTEDAYKSASNTTVVFNDVELDTNKAYLITLVGSLNDGDVYQSIVRYREGSWTQAILTMGLETPTTPVLTLTANTVAISCFNSAQSDPEVTVHIRCIETVVKPS